MEPYETSLNHSMEVWTGMWMHEPSFGSGLLVVWTHGTSFWIKIHCSVEAWNSSSVEGGTSLDHIAVWRHETR